MHGALEMMLKCSLICSSGAFIANINVQAMNKHASAGGAFLLSSLKQYGCEGDVGKAVEAVFATNCVQSEMRASLCCQVLEAFLHHIAQGGEAAATTSSFGGKGDLLSLCRWKLSVDMPFSISTLQVLCDKLASTLVRRFSRARVTLILNALQHEIFERARCLPPGLL